MMEWKEEDQGNSESDSDALSDSSNNRNDNVEAPAPNERVNSSSFTIVSSVNRFLLSIFCLGLGSIGIEIDVIC